MKKIIFLLLISILLVQTVSAFTFLNIYVDKSGEATFIGETSENISFPSGIKVKGSNIVGKTQILTSKSAEVWRVDYSLEGAEINLILPKGSVIKSISNGEISINKNQISIFFTESISVSYTIDKSLSESLGFSSNTALLIIIFLAILVILIVFLINYSKREDSKEKIQEVVKEKKSNKLKFLTQILSDREKLIIKKLKEIGKIKSSQLRKLTNIPKASFSRHIQELEKKKLVKRTGEGKNKFIELLK